MFLCIFLCSFLCPCFWAPALTTANCLVSVLRGTSGTKIMKGFLLPIPPSPHPLFLSLNFPNSDYGRPIVSPLLLSFIGHAHTLHHSPPCRSKLPVYINVAYSQPTQLVLSFCLHASIQVRIIMYNPSCRDHYWNSYGYMHPLPPCCNKLANPNFSFPPLLGGNIKFSAFRLP